MELDFRNQIGAQLAASLELPDVVARPAVVVFAHGFGSGRWSSRNRAIAEYLVSSGIAAFLIDFTGHGDSAGSQEGATIERMVQDLRAALDVLSARPDVNPALIGLSGSSSGGIVAMLAAASDARIKSLVLRSVPAEGLFEAAQKISIPTLVIAGERDFPIVEEDRALAEAIPGKHEFVVIAGAGHLFEEAGQAEEVAKLSAAWFIEHLRTGAASEVREQGVGLR